MELYFLTGMVIAVATSTLFIPREMHDARGITLLACMGAAALTGWVLTTIEAPRTAAWVGATLSAIIAARFSVHRALGPQRARTTTQVHGGSNQRPRIMV